MPSINHVIMCYIGKRRRVDVENFIPFQLGFLREVPSKHVTQFTFVFNQDVKTHVDGIPRKIRGIPVRVVLRPNDRDPYRGFLEVFERFNDDFDYYIYSEDDYAFVMENYDDYLLQRFKKLDKCGYLCTHINTNPSLHAGSTTGLISTEALIAAWELEGKFDLDRRVWGEQANTGEWKPGLPYIADQSQVNFSTMLLNAGYRIYDITDTDLSIFFEGSNQSIEYRGNLAGKPLIAPYQFFRYQEQGVTDRNVYIRP